MTTTRIRRASALIAALVATLAAAPAFAQYSAPMHDTENPDHSAFMMNANVEIDPPFVNGFLTFPTPPGKRYFIEQMSVTCTAFSTSDSITQAILTPLQKLSATSEMYYSGPQAVMVRTGPAFGGGAIWTGSTWVNAFADPDPFSTDGGAGIVIDVFHAESQNVASCSGYIAGHTLPQ